MNVTYKFRDVAAASVQGMLCIYAKTLVDYPGIIISYFIVNFTKISANTITYMGAVFAVISMGYVFFENINSAALFFYLAFVCDFMDGKVARIRKTASHFGKKIDLAFDRIIFICLVMMYLNYFEIMGMHQEQMLLMAYAMIFLTYDVLELTSSLVFSRILIDQLGKGDKINQKKKNEIVNPFINSLKKWIPSRVGSVGIVFIAAPLISFKILYFIGLIAVTIRFIWLLRSYFKQ